MNKRCEFIEVAAYNKPMQTYLILIFNWPVLPVSAIRLSL